MLPEFDLVQPRSLEEALEALAAENGRAVPLAGGTNLLVDLRARRTSADRVVSLAALDELRGIGRKDGRIALGARTTLSELLRHRLMAEEAPALVAATRVFGGAMVRNVATVAGNVCYGSPAADLVPPLLTLDAEVVLASREGTRAVPLDEFTTGVRQTVRRADELLTEIRWPALPPRSANLFYKLGLRKGDAIAVAGAAVALTAEAGTCSRARIALAAVAPVVKRAHDAEAILTGKTLTPAVIDEAARQAKAECSPIDDVRASAEYRRHVIEVLIRRLLAQAWDELD
ncbi:MAG: FAD binding domain-containing protein [Alphaproteobacteria bacterium]